MFLVIMLELIVCADYFLPTYSGYILDFIALALTFLAVRFSENHLRQFQASAQMFYGLIIPFVIFASLSWYSMNHANLEKVNIYTEVRDANTRDYLHGAVIYSYTRPDQRWETGLNGLAHVQLENVSRQQQLILLVDFNGFEREKIVIEPKELKREIQLDEVHLRPKTVTK